MHVSLLQGMAGSDPAAGRGTGAAARADSHASSPAAFRALVDVLAHAADPETPASAAGAPGDAAFGEAIENLSEGQSANASSDPSSQSSAAPVPAAILARLTGAPTSADGEPAADDPSAAGANHGRTTEPPSADSSRGEATDGTDGAGNTAVPVWTADLPNPVALAAPGTSRGESGDGAGGQHAGPQGRGGNGPRGSMRDRGVAIVNQQDTVALAGHAAADVVDELQNADAATGRSGDLPSRGAEHGAAFQRALADAVTDAAQATPRADLKPAHAASSSAQTRAAASAASAAAPRPAATPDALAASVAASARSEATRTASIVAPHVVTSGGSIHAPGLLVATAHAASAPPADAMPETTAAQIVQTLRLVASGDGGEAHITLEPSHFGGLSVAIRVEHGQVVARMQAESPLVREWLQANQHTLRQQLADQQLTLDRLDVAEPDEPGSASSGRRDGGEHRDGDERRPARRHPAPESDARFEVVA